MKDWFENVHKFDWKDLQGMVLRIVAGGDEIEGVKSTCVMGVDESLDTIMPSTLNNVSRVDKGETR